MLARTVVPSLVYDNESDIPRSETMSARAPHSTDNLLRVFSDPRNGSPSQEFSLEDAFEFLQPPLIANEVANAIYTDGPQFGKSTDVGSYNWTYPCSQHTRAT